MKRFLFIAFTFCATHTFAQSVYFPPLLGNNWDTLQPQSLGWCNEKVDSLYDFLDAKNTKAFIVLKDGKMVLEKYFGTFTQDSVWYWASAGKSLTSFLVGQAQEQGVLSINDTTSQYLGTGWTSEPLNKEQLITIRNQLTMTTGLDDAVLDNHCFIDTCLQYLADAGTRWAYHNAPYTLLDSVMENATGQSLNGFTNANVGSHIGMYGLWLWLDYDHVYFSTARSMARYGLLISNNGIWNNDTLLHDAQYFHDMTNSSQPLNPSYGYLWWLNGKGSYMLPQSQLLFNTDLIPNAPDDLIAALGKNDQKIYVVPSQGLVVIRMGNAAELPMFALSSFDNELWGKLMNLECALGVSEVETKPLNVYPNPTSDVLNVNNLNLSDYRLNIFDALGRLVLTTEDQNRVDVHSLHQGVYTVKVVSANVVYTTFFHKQ